VKGLLRGVVSLSRGERGREDMGRWDRGGVHTTHAGYICK
jgi:hypothetical protein